MKDFITYFVYPLIMAFSSMVYLDLVKEDEFKYYTEGKTKQDFRNMKESCEKDLPRNQNCVIFIEYKPETKEK